MDQLDSFLIRVKSPIAVDEFLSRYSELFSFVISQGLAADYRLARGRLKRLRDEITPAVRFIRLHAEAKDEVQFALNSTVPDCTLWHRQSDWRRTVEITISQARERFHLMKELNAKGHGRGFVGLGDDSPTPDFVHALSDEPRMYSTSEAQAAIARAVSLCAGKKEYSEAHTLLIEAPLRLLPYGRWVDCLPRLSEIVLPLHFSEIFLVGDHAQASACLRLK